MTTMGMLCLDTEGCNFQNRDKARFCAQCGIPLQGTLLQDRYEILSFTGKDRTTITFNAHDRHEDRPVTIRALRPTQASAAEQESFLQDADMAVLLSSHTGTGQYSRYRLWTRWTHRFSREIRIFSTIAAF